MNVRCSTVRTRVRSGTASQSVLPVKTITIIVLIAEERQAHTLHLHCIFSFDVVAWFSVS